MSIEELKTKKEELCKLVYDQLNNEFPVFENEMNVITVDSIRGNEGFHGVKINFCIEREDFVQPDEDDDDYEEDFDDDRCETETMGTLRILSSRIGFLYKIYNAPMEFDGHGWQKWFWIFVNYFMKFEESDQHHPFHVEMRKRLEEINNIYRTIQESEKK